jgi:hypothetical protein
VRDTRVPREMFARGTSSIPESFGKTKAQKRRRRRKRKSGLTLACPGGTLPTPPGAWADPGASASRVTPPSYRCASGRNAPASTVDGWGRLWAEPGPTRRRTVVPRAAPSIGAAKQHLGSYKTPSSRARSRHPEFRAVPNSRKRTRRPGLRLVIRRPCHRRLAFAATPKDRRRASGGSAFRWGRRHRYPRAQPDTARVRWRAPERCRIPAQSECRLHRR